VGIHPLTPRLRLVAVATTATATLFAVAHATATVAPGRGIAGVTLRMTEAQVRAQLGLPLRVTRTRGALGFLVTRLYYPRVDVDLQSLVTRPVVIRVLTTRRGETTTSGVGVGSPIAAVEHVRGVHCWRETGMHYCGLGERKPLRPFTLFWIGAAAHVTLIEVSLTVNS
jgi:hypothetical protein